MMVPTLSVKSEVPIALQNQMIAYDPFRGISLERICKLITEDAQELLNLKEVDGRPQLQSTLCSLSFDVRTQVRTHEDHRLVKFDSVTFAQNVTLRAADEIGVLAKLAGKSFKVLTIIGPKEFEIDLDVGCLSMAEREFECIGQIVTPLNMYKLSPEVVMPRTIVEERIVVLQNAADLDLLRSSVHSESDLTLKKFLSLSDIGGTRRMVRAGLTIHGRLSANGAVRRSYWSRGESRLQIWRTTARHGRMQQMADCVPEGVGELEDRLWKLDALEVGDILVLRSGVSYAELFEDSLPAEIFVSHWWGEETPLFLKTLVRHCETLESCADTHNDHSHWVCTLCVRQHRVELGDRIEDSPFYQVLLRLSTQSCCSVVVALDDDAMPMTRIWCIFEAFLCSKLGIAYKLFTCDGEIHECLSSDKVSVRRAAEALVSKLLAMDLRDARASVQADHQRIIRKIQDEEGGLDKVEHTVKQSVASLTELVANMQRVHNPSTGERIDLDKGILSLHLWRREFGGVYFDVATFWINITFLILATFGFGFKSKYYTTYDVELDLDTLRLNPASGFFFLPEFILGLTLAMGAVYLLLSIVELVKQRIRSRVACCVGVLFGVLLLACALFSVWGFGLFATSCVHVNDWTDFKERERWISDTRRFCKETKKNREAEAVFESCRQGDELKAGKSEEEIEEECKQKMLKIADPGYVTKKSEFNNKYPAEVEKALKGETFLPSKWHCYGSGLLATYKTCSTKPCRLLLKLQLDAIDLRGTILAIVVVALVRIATLQSKHNLSLTVMERFMKLCSQPRLAIVAPAGGGKSTLSKMIVRMACRNGRASLRVPIAELAQCLQSSLPQGLRIEPKHCGDTELALLKCDSKKSARSLSNSIQQNERNVRADFANADTIDTLEHWASERFGVDGAKLIRDNGLVVVFDGLDEAGASSREVLSFISKWMEERRASQKKDVVVITSRPRELGALARLTLWWQGFRMFELETLSLEDAEDLCWKKMILRGDSCVKLKQQVIERLQHLTVNGKEHLYQRPFMASLLVDYLLSVASDSGEHAKHVTTLSIMAEMWARLAKQTAAATLIPLIRVDRLIKKLAANMAKQRSRLASQDDLKKHCGQDEGAMLFEAATRGELLAFEAVQNGRAIQFTHMLLTEYLAACFLWEHGRESVQWWDLLENVRDGQQEVRNYVCKFIASSDHLDFETRESRVIGVVEYPLELTAFCQDAEATRIVLDIQCKTNDWKRAMRSAKRGRSFMTMWKFCRTISILAQYSSSTRDVVFEVAKMMFPLFDLLCPSFAITSVFAFGMHPAWLLIWILPSLPATISSLLDLRHVLCFLVLGYAVAFSRSEASFQMVAIVWGVIIASCCFFAWLCFVAHGGFGLGYLGVFFGFWNISSFTPHRYCFAYISPAIALSFFLSLFYNVAGHRGSGQTNVNYVRMFACLLFVSLFYNVASVILACAVVVSRNVKACVSRKRNRKELLVAGRQSSQQFSVDREVYEGESTQHHLSNAVNAVPVIDVVMDILR